MATVRIKQRFQILCRIWGKWYGDCGWVDCIFSKRIIAVKLDEITLKVSVTKRCPQGDIISMYTCGW